MKRGLFGGRGGVLIMCCVGGVFAVERIGGARVELLPSAEVLVGG